MKFARDCKRKIGNIEDVNIYFVNACEVEVKFYEDFVDGGNDMAYGVDSKKATVKFMPSNEIWLDSHIDLFELRFVCIHEAYERSLMKNTNMEYDEAHEHANKLEKKLKRQFMDRFAK